MVDHFDAVAGVADDMDVELYIYMGICYMVPWGVQLHVCLSFVPK